MPGSLLASFSSYVMVYPSALSDTYNYPFITEDEIGAQKAIGGARV